MSRPAVVGVIFGALVASAVAVAGARYLDIVQQQPPLVRALVFGLVAYGVLLATFTVSRVVDPRLPIPLVAYPVLFAFILMSAAGSAKRREEEGRLPGDYEDRDVGIDDKHMGRGWAIFVVLLALGMCAGAITYAHVLQTRVS